MSRPTLKVAELRGLASSLQPHEDLDCQSPRSKRPRLEKPGLVSEAWWTLPLVPRLSEVEKTWELPPRPFEALFSLNVNFDSSSHSCVNTLLSNRECPNSKIEKKSWLWALPSQHFDSGLTTPGRSCEQKLDVRGVSLVENSDTSKGETNQPLSKPTWCDLYGKKTKNGNHCLVQGTQDSQKDSRDRKQAENPFLVVTFYKKAKSTLHEIKNRCKAHSVMPSSKKENNVLASILEISKPPIQPSLEIVKPFYFRDNSTISILEFPTDLHSKMSSVYLKEIAKKKIDKNKTYARDFTTIYFSQNRPESKRQTLQNDNKMVAAEKTLSQCYEGYYQSLSNKNTCKRKEDLISLNYYNHSSVKSDVRISQKIITIILGNAKRKETEMCLDRYMSKSKSSESNTLCILKRKWENCGTLHKYKTNCETWKISGEKLNLQEFLEIYLLHKEDYHSTRTMNLYKEQSKPLMTGTMGSKKTLIKIICLGGKNNMRQLSYYSAQKILILSNILESFIKEILCFHKDISRSKRDNTLACYEILKSKNKIAIKNLITKTMNVDRKNDVVSIYIQNALEMLNIILKVNDSLDSSKKVEDEFKLEEKHIFKWLMDLNDQKIIIVEHYLAYLVRILTFPQMLKDNMAPVLKKRKLFETGEVSERYKKKFSSVTSKKMCFTIFESYQNNSLLMHFDDLKDISVTSEISCKDNYPEGILNMDNLTYFSPIKTKVKSDPQFIQNDQYTNGNIYEISLLNQDSVTKRKPHIITNFQCECMPEDVFNVQQQVIPTDHRTIYGQQASTSTVTQVPNLGNLLNGIEGEMYNIVLKEEVKIVTQSLTNTCQIHKDVKMEKDKKKSFSPMDGKFSAQSASLMSEKVNVGDAMQTNQMLANRNKSVDARNEYESILQESELANSKHFHRNNDSTECVNHQFKTDLHAGNNECFQDITAKCLSTEAQTMGKDFEMRSKFDLVLQELHMFHEISKENEILSTMATNIGQDNYFGESNGTEKAERERRNDLNLVTGNKMCASPLLSDMTVGPKMHKRHQSSFKWRTVSNKGEQEVPIQYYCPKASEEDLLYPASEEDCVKSLPQRPALLPDTFKEEKCNYSLRGGSYFSHGILRVHPLKTCSGPIRIGLSRKAKLKQLHPYLK
ncbi:PREDICTED: RAD51-associated protein 2 [Elephantulus edwardii]|uniref:RAD51-associated protein 2 n=1 Tax=Elephantulus edwardii TaxID=28737 RepID=UPI0003F0A330|nr:PREDICTED: RAD51-associated protein 2 [Elephantulus edwardii]